MHNLKNTPRSRRAADAVAMPAAFDEETGVASRELFRSRVDVQWEQCQAERLPLGILLIKVEGLLDCFHNGHGESAEGSVARIGGLISNACRRRSDFAGRLRLDEFGVMLVESQPDGTRQVAGTILEAIRKAAIPHPAGVSQAPLTLAVGGACTIPSMNRFANSLLIIANRALETAVDRGGDCLEFIGD